MRKCWCTTSLEILTYRPNRQFHGSLESWLDKHGIDIFAIQEVKARHEVIRDTPGVVGADLAGWDSFWSPCRLKGSAGGFNGVATFARRGLCASANCTPLDDEELDIEGRAILTDHGDFLLFNVSVPNDSTGASRLPFKMRFLHRLRSYPPHDLHIPLPPPSLACA